MKTLRKEWKSGSKELYHAAKRRAKAKVYTAKKRAKEQTFANNLRGDYEKKEIFKVAKQMIKTNQDVVGEAGLRRPGEGQ